MERQCFTGSRHSLQGGFLRSCRSSYSPCSHTQLAGRQDPAAPQAHRASCGRASRSALQARKARADGFGSTRQKPPGQDELLLGNEAGEGEVQELEHASFSGRQEQASPGLPVAACLSESRTLEELFAAVMQQADSMGGADSAAALKCVARLSKGGARKMRGVPALPALFAALERGAEELGPKDVAQALWSLAKLRANRPRLLRVLADQVSALVADMNAQDLATVVWAFGALQYHPDGALQQQLARAARSTFDQFQPQGISMLLWGFAKLDIAPDADLNRVSRQHFAANMPRYHHQAVANMLYSLARLRQCTPRLCANAEGHIVQRLDEFTPQELMNMLWAFAQARFMPQQFLLALGKHLAQDGVAGSFRGTDWAALVWGSASLGAPLAHAALDAVSLHGAQCLVEMKPVELCNLLWGLGVLGECRQPMFPEALALLLGETEQRLMEPRLLRQLLQASLMAQAQGVSAELPAHVERAALKWWRTTCNTVPSLSHLRVSGLLKDLGVEHSLMVSVEESLPIVDIALAAEASEQPLAMQVIGPHETAVNTGELLGRAQADTRLLAGKGWRTIHLPVAALSGSEQEQQVQVATVLRDAGVHVDVPGSTKSFGLGKQGSRVPDSAGRKRGEQCSAMQ